jgi:hypothetical protein
MINLQNLKSFKKGQDNRRNLKGRPKGVKNKKTQLRKLIKDIIHIHNGEINEYTKKLLYQLYEVAMTDLSVDYISETVSDLYFIESDFGIKIGISKNPVQRLYQIQLYAPSSKILKVIKNAGAFEKTLHNYFRKQNIKNNPLYGIEWFYKNDDLLNFIDSIDTSMDLVNRFGSKNVKQLQIQF